MSWTPHPRDRLILTRTCFQDVKTEVRRRVEGEWVWQELTQACLLYLPSEHNPVGPWGH